MIVLSASIVFGPYDRDGVHPPSGGSDGPHDIFRSYGSDPAGSPWRRCEVARGNGMYVQ